MQIYQKYILAIVVVGLTMISIDAGFSLYMSLLGIGMALLISIIFEIFRLVCLYALVNNQLLSRMFSVPLYVLIASVCALAAITSLHTKITSAENTIQYPLEMEQNRRIALIKQVYVQKATKQINEIDKKIDVCKRKLAWNEHAGYWQRRLEQLENEKRMILDVQDRFLKSTPLIERDKWIAEYAAKLNLTFKPLEQMDGGSSAVTSTIHQMWGITTLQAKKIVSSLVVLVTEIGIVVLSLILKGNVVRRARVVVKKTEKQVIPNRKTTSKFQMSQSEYKELSGQFSEAEIVTFVAANNDVLQKHGRLPYARELSKRQREIRKSIAQLKG
ncbi:MAG: hypothetical protein H6696_05600 [Deferribacteres bacterium]|nr:hypothetical protein [candidate division KSB1 bacterium]MCB9501393.1 hypothetical protein [Deferribacteres bacterium]